MKQISGQAVRDGLTNDFMSDEDINEWLRIYRENLNDDTVTHEELLYEVNLMLPSVCLSELVRKSNYHPNLPINYGHHLIDCII